MVVVSFLACTDEENYLSTFTHLFFSDNQLSAFWGVLDGIGIRLWLFGYGMGVFG
jgi:hypothetical protein